MTHEIALLLLRIFIGSVFFFQGYDKVFRVKISGVADAFRTELQNHDMPSPVVTFAAFITSYIELICGLLLILGLFKQAALYLLTIDVIIASLAFSIMKPMWNMQHVFPRLAILMALLLLPQNWDIFTLDAYIHLP